MKLGRERGLGDIDSSWLGKIQKMSKKLEVLGRRNKIDNSSFTISNGPFDL